ncbi:sterile alpha motif domain-containing protein 9-like [Onychostoma macrolepis]|uniref:sterile alpha motif domain-containing protein 9-like n=1 Tax=Onychostoma macrolepis TaxID=369639 RepID=UPI00272BCF0C|nr:sterile alpha motif domain-containing protein 9-like [Onychostoma macrolepis]
MMYLIPSSGETPISITAELRDSLSCLDIVWSDMFESEDSVINSKVCRKHETDFLKGDPPQWLIFYTSANSPLVERDCFKDLIQLIERKKKKHRLITEVSLRYQPGSGGSTLAMQVLWHFRKDLRCVRVIASKLDTKELSKQVVDLFLLSSEEQGQKTVLLLLDIQENTNDNLQIKNSLRKNLNEEIHQRDITTNTPVVIIFNCSSAYCLTTAEATADVKLKMELSPHEKQRFEQKKKELKKKHKETSQEFHAFNIMQGGFKKEDAEKVITEEMINHVKNHKESSSTRLLSFLALINSYVPGSHLSKLFCQEFMDQTEQPTDEEKPTLETIMKPFMDLIVIFSKEEQEANCIRLAHPMIADACLKLFTESKLTRFDIAKDFLNSLVKGKESNYVRICNNMLVRRLQTEQGKQTFSRLILDIINERENNANQCICLLELASDLFSTDPVYPQTLARLFYIKVKEDNKYEEARKWATLAIKRDPKNSHIRDTLGQVHKNHLLNETKKQHSDINMYLAIAQSAIKAFKDEEEAAEGESEDDTGFSNRGLFGFLQVCKIIHPKMNFHQYINSLGCDVEKKYDFFEWFLAFSRPNIEDEDPDYIRRDIEKCYKLYCTQRKKMALNEKK